jgi:hypothetical protein
MNVIFSKLFKAGIAYLILFSFSFLSCTNNEKVAGGVVETGNAIELTGRVLDKNGEPVFGVVAKLAKKGYSDTTGPDGKYIIEGEVNKQNNDINTGDILDTVIFLQKGQRFASINVVKWIDSLPDVRIVQRDISGEIDPVTITISRIEAILTGDSIPEEQAIVTELYYFEDTYTYSGFVNSPATVEVQNYEVYVNVYDYDGKIIGRSDVVYFNSLAGDITIPSFNPLNAKPIANAGSDTIVSINDTIYLHGSAEDAFEGSIEKWEWNINGNGFVETSTGDTSFIAPDAEYLNFTCVLKVTDNDGNIAIDTIMIEVLTDAPAVTIGGHSTVTINTPISFTAIATQQFGEIVKYRWDDGIESGFDDSSGSEYTATYLEEKTFTVTVEAEDDDGNTGIAKKTIVVTNDAPILTGFNDMAISPNDVVTFTVNAVDSSGIKEYHWDFNDGSENQYDTTVENTISHKFPATSMVCTVSVTAVDSFDKATTDIAIIRIVDDAPMLFAYANPKIVSINDTVWLNGNAEDVLGTIEKWEWDIGNKGNFIQTSGPDTVIIVPSESEQNFLCVLRVTDDDMNTQAYAVSINILLDLPYAEITTSSDSVEVDSTYSLGFAFSNPGDFGHIIAYELSIGSYDDFTEISGIDTVLTAPSSEQSGYPIVLKVTDDDLNNDLDTLYIDFYTP